MESPLSPASLNSKSLGDRSMIHPNPVAAAGVGAGVGSTGTGGGPIRLVAPERHPAGYYKSLGLDVLGIFAALALGYAYYAYLANGLSLWFTGAAFLVFGAIAALQALLQKKANRRALVILGETLAFGAWFAYVDPAILASALGVLFIVLWWGYLQSRSEFAYTTEIRFFRVTRDAVGKAATGVLVAMILFYLAIAAGAGVGASGASDGSATANGLFISEATFQPVYAWAVGAFNNFYPGIFLSGPFNTFAQSVVQQDLQQNPQYQALPAAQQASTTAVAAAQFTQSLSARLGVPIASSSMTVDVFYGSIIEALRGAREKLQNWFLVGWSLVIFLILRSIGMIVVWLAQFLGLMAYESLLSSGFMKVVQHPDIKEEIEY